MTIASSAGTAYVPGESQTFTVAIAPAQAKLFGFQMTARPDANAVLGQAGDFSAGPQQIVLCDDGSPKPSGGCTVQTQTVEFVEHSSPQPGGLSNVTWTAPPSNAGTVTLYVAAVAADGDSSSLGDRVYTAQLTLCPVLLSGQPKPAIASVASAGGFNANAGIAPGTWIEIYGSNLAAAACSWQTADFNGANAPTSLGGVSVTVGGKSAYVDYVSAGQVNAQVPDGIPIGPATPVVVTNSGGSSAAFAVTTAVLAPALLAPAQAPFNVNGKQYVVATLADGSFDAIPSHPAKPGDVITLFGIGFGLPGAGMVAQQTATLSNVAFSLNETAAQTLYAGIAPGFVGLYQFNIQLPNVTPGDYQLKATVNGAAVNQTVYVAVGQ